MSDLAARQPVLPGDVRVLIRENTHPGLQLDKYSPVEVASGEGSRPALEPIVRKSQNFASDVEYASLFQRQDDFLGASVKRFRMRTRAPLSLHLARAAALENVGIALHPIYGFPWIPGTGLKGMAKAYAETVADLDDETRARIFGELDLAGSVIFYDAWPVQWPTLSIDILNCHHRRYYDGQQAPVDSENPVPVQFLAVKPGAEFQFWLAGRGARPEDLDRAAQCLRGALEKLGAGAKTNAGYGGFDPAGDVPPFIPPAKPWPSYEATVSLVTPAFLAGAEQGAGDCDVRGATIRGLLRSWWRIMHAAHVDLRTLRAMESLIFGDTTRAGAVKVDVWRTGHSNEATVFSEKDARLGLRYLLYGMNDRHYLPPGIMFSLSLFAQTRKNGEREISADRLLREATNALSLLCAYGGMGSKSRKGFGSLSLSSASACDIKGIQEHARDFRATFGATESSSKERQQATLDSMCVEEIDISGADAWDVCNRIGMAYQSFAQLHKGKPDKCGLGLPRKGQRVEGFLRFASPFHFSVHPHGNGLQVRIAAFPANYLGRLDVSQKFTKKLIDHMKSSLKPESAHASQEPPRKNLTRKLGDFFKDRN